MTFATFTPAQAEDYAAWLRLALANGRTFTHFYDYPFPNDVFVIAHSDFTTSGEAGASSRNILIAPGVEHLGGALGHSQLLYADGTTRPGSGCWIPVYADPAFDDLPGFGEFKKLKQASQRERAAQQETETQEWKAARNASDLGRHVTSAPQQATMTCPSAGTPMAVFVDGQKIALLPSTLPCRLTLDEATELIGQIQAAIRGASL